MNCLNPKHLTKVQPNEAQAKDQFPLVSVSDLAMKTGAPGNAIDPTSEKGTKLSIIIGKGTLSELRLLDF